MKKLTSIFALLLIFLLANINVQAATITSSNPKVEMTYGEFVSNCKRLESKYDIKLDIPDVQTYSQAISNRDKENISSGPSYNSFDEFENYLISKAEEKNKTKKNEIIYVKKDQNKVSTGDSMAPLS